MSENVQHVIICALATSGDAVAGSVFHHKCMDCGQHVAVAPSGQRALLAQPASVFLCLPCFMKRPPDPSDEHKLAPGASDELREWLASCVRRPTRQ